LAQAAHHRSDAGKKARLPNLQLSADLFKSSVRLDNIGGTRANWNLVGALLQPIFDGGRLRSESQARQAEAQAALMELQDRILHALQEVEEALIHERELAVQSEALDQAVSASARSSQYYDQRYRQGLDNLQSLLIAKEQEISLKLRLSDTTAQRLLNRVDLSLALGMGLEKASTSSLKVSQHASQN
jgi:outer membrane protein TolC